MTYSVTLAITDPITRERVAEWQDDLEEEIRQHDLQDQVIQDAALSDDIIATRKWWNDLNNGFIVNELTGLARQIDLHEHRELVETAGDSAPADAHEALRRRILDESLIDDFYDDTPFILAEI